MARSAMALPGWTAAWLLALGAGAEPQAQAHLTLRIEGMSCEPCASAVELQLGETEGVTGYQVSYERAEARLSYDPARTTPEKIIRTLGATGFRFAIVPAADGGAAPAELTLLGDSPAALRSAFNASRGKPRFLAILSPTCGLCLHGADAVRAALLDEQADARLELLVVWAPMLPGDDLAAARGSSARVRHARVRQFYDPGRRVGTAFRAEVFPDAVARMRASLPPGHFLTRPFATRDPAQPEWDVYLFFGPDSQWSATAPTPRRFVRQVELRDGRTSVLWKDDYARPPIEASLEVELRRAAAALLGRP